MARSHCCLLIYVNHTLVLNLNVTNMSFNAISENKTLAKISEFTVFFNFDGVCSRFQGFIRACILVSLAFNVAVPLK